MSEQELKHVIAQLLEDARRLQQVEPNAGTEARIHVAENALGSNEPSIIRDSRPMGVVSKMFYSSSLPSNKLGMR